MPKSRRDRPVSLTKVQKHGRVIKDRLLQSVRDCCAGYSSLYVFELHNPRNRGMKEMRESWGQGSRFFLGKNRVMQTALGRQKDAEIIAGAAELSRHLVGPRGLLFTNQDAEQVRQHFDSFQEVTYARSGCTAERTFSLAAGPLPSDTCPHPIEPQLRKLGLPTKLSAGVIQLLKDVQVCAEGDVLTPEQCQLLQIFQQPMATFRIELIAHLHDGECEVLSEGAAEGVQVEHAEGIEMEDDEEVEEKKVAEIEEEAEQVAEVKQSKNKKKKEPVARKTRSKKAIADETAEITDAELALLEESGELDGEMTVSSPFVVGDVAVPDYNSLSAASQPTTRTSSRRKKETSVTEAAASGGASRRKRKAT